MTELDKHCYLTKSTDLKEGSLFMGRTVSIIERVVIEGTEYLKITTCNINFRI